MRPSVALECRPVSLEFTLPGNGKLNFASSTVCFVSLVEPDRSVKLDTLPSVVLFRFKPSKSDSIRTCQVQGRRKYSQPAGFKGGRERIEYGGIGLMSAITARTSVVPHVIFDTAGQPWGEHDKIIQISIQCCHAWTRAQQEQTMGMLTYKWCTGSQINWSMLISKEWLGKLEVQGLGKGLGIISALSSRACGLQVQASYCGTVTAL
ncbi:hypothetical protein F5Y06DRAFT_271263 [Hypoxylon sp. FL0890]|nr:hypothetical protein F5Y06DRAFT_271263 [Hypoxylon sp. FL0890]